MVNKTRVSALRQKEAVEKYRKKLNILEQLLLAGEVPSTFKTTLSSFAGWTDEKLEVEELSRPVLYSDAAEYLPLHERRQAVLTAIDDYRTRKPAKKKSIEAELREQLSFVSRRAQSYVDQYTAVMAELVVARRDIARLELDARAKVVTQARVVRLRAVVSAVDVDAAQPESTHVRPT